jgi:uncharacterized repeat protein (TIGR01451 family)
MYDSRVLRKFYWKSGVWLFISFSVLFLTVFFLASRATAAAVQQIERVSVGTGGVQGNYESFYAATSADANIIAFESFNTGWGPDQPDVNYVDVFVRDRAENVTRKVSIGSGGEPADERSFHPAVSADGRYTSFTSYASNLVPNDTNGNDIGSSGLDVFVYDWQTNQLQRVSLTWDGRQIEGNTVGFISGDGRSIVFASNGSNIARNDIPAGGHEAIYIRDLVTGNVERISRAANGDFPNGYVVAPEANHDGRFIVYLSEASNLAPGSSAPTFRDVLLYDRQTQQTRVVSRPPGDGLSNGRSGPARITPDGRYIVFRSEASNLVPGDTNGKADIFVFDRTTGSIELVNRSYTGALANADSRDPSICGNGRYVSFVSDATNLVPQPNNGHRQVYIRDREANNTFLITMNANGELGNGRGHRAEIARDCLSVAFASEASNLVPGDTNNVRDLFVGRIIPPANFGASDLRLTGGVLEPGQTVRYTFTARNAGLAANASVTNHLPPQVGIVPGSLTNGALYDAQTHRVTWSGPLPTEGQAAFSYQVTISNSLTDFTLINNQVVLTGDGQSRNFQVLFAVNGLRTYLPLITR